MTPLTKLLIEQKERFDEKYCRRDREGKSQDYWFIPETLTPRELKSFASSLPIEALKEMVKYMEKKKKPE